METCALPPLEAAGQPAHDPHALLQIWLSPAFPVGGFAYSQGLETAAANGWIATPDDAATWLSALIHHGALRNDLILLSMAFRAAVSEDWPMLAGTAALARALPPSAERHLETTQQGYSFRAIIEAAWPAARATRGFAALDDSPAYPVAVAIAAAAHAIPLAPTLAAYATAAVHGLLSAIIRLGVIGQTDGQRILASLQPAILAVAAQSTTLGESDIGSATLSADLCSLLHETLPTRIFRS